MDGASVSRAGPAGAAREGVGAGRRGHQEREGEAGAETEAAALGPDASAVRLDQALADGKSKPAADLAVAVPGGGVFAEELPEALRRDAPSLVCNRDRDMHPVAFRSDPYGCGVRGVACGIGQEVVQHLHDALAVGQHRRQAGRQVDQEGVSGAAGEEGVAGLVHQGADLRGLGRDRERAGFDAPGIEQVGDQADHAVEHHDADRRGLDHPADRGGAQPGIAVRGRRAGRRAALRADPRPKLLNLRGGAIDNVPSF